MRLTLLVLALTAVAISAPLTESDANRDRVLRPAQPVQGTGTLLDFGVQALERLPWNPAVLRLDLAAQRPVAVAAAYLMDRHLLVLSNTGMVYALDRNTLEPAWVTSLRFSLDAPPADGPTHYAFLTKDHRGSSWVEAVDARTGVIANRFPRRLDFAATSGIDATAGSVFVPSLGSPRDNRTLETVNLVTGRRGWGFRTSGLIFGSPVVTVGGSNVIVAGQDGVLTSLPATVTAPNEVNWRRSVAGALGASPTVTEEHVFIGNHDGLFHCLDVLSGEVIWLTTVDARINESAWVLGSYRTVELPSPVEGGEPLEAQRWVGEVFVRNRLGTHAFDGPTGTPLFKDRTGSKPVVRQGKWLGMVDAGRDLCLRNAENGWKIEARLSLKMFGLIPSNRADGALYCITPDGGVAAALPR